MYSLPRMRGRVGEGVSAHALSFLRAPHSFCVRPPPPPPPPPSPSPASGGGDHGAPPLQPPMSLNPRGQSRSRWPVILPALPPPCYQGARQRRLSPGDSDAAQYQ